MEGPPQVWEILPDPRVLLDFPRSGEISRQPGTRDVEVPHAQVDVFEKTLIQRVKFALSLLLSLVPLLILVVGRRVLFHGEGSKWDTRDEAMS
jgi:hypothetical protein